MAGRAVHQFSLLGQKLGHYRIIEQIGMGGMGVVYRAQDEHLDRDVAVKVLPVGTLCDVNARRRFEKEARALSKLNHPNIATIHDFDSQGELDYLVMEYVAGKGLRDKVSEGPLPRTETLHLATQLAHGLRAAHERGLVHRDLKPENVRLTVDGRPKILDFGLAKLIRPLFCTTEGNISAVAGTPLYMAPEQLLGGVADQRTDVFSFGVVLYEMATGRRPISEKGEQQLCPGMMSSSVMPPTSLNPEVSPELERIIFKCLEKQPDKRYQSAKELAGELQDTALIAGVAPQRSAAKLHHWPKNTVRKSWAKNAAVGVLALAVALIIASYLVHWRRSYVLSQADSIVVADFINSTGDPVFDDTLNQALTVELEQSPFLKILPQPKIRDTLRLMGRASDQHLTSELARELCQRVGARAVLSGSIATLGTHYVIGLTAANCSSGSHIASEQLESPTKEAVLTMLGKAASRLRGKLGESLSSVQKFDMPLEQATTPSLDALKAYSVGRKMQYQKGNSAAIPYFKRAIELDPNFAVAHAGLGLCYSNLGEPGLAEQYLQRAYELRDHVSEREQLRISSSYYSFIRGDLVKGTEIYEQWAQAYPRDGVPPGNLGAIYLYAGQYEKALTQTLQHLRLDPDDSMGYGNLIVAYGALNRLDEAMAVYQEAMKRDLDDVGLHGNLYGIAFLQGNRTEMERQVAWAVGTPGAEDTLLSFASDTEAFFGHLSQARTLSQRAVEAAQRSDQKETAAGWQMNAAAREAEFGNSAQALKIMSSALAVASTRDVQILAALVAARSGALPKAERLAQSLAKRYPYDTLVVSYWLPTISAAIEIHRNNPSKALSLLQVTTPYEWGEPYPSFQSGSCVYPVYLRAQAYLLLRRPEEAAAEFQKILDHPGVVMNCPVGALAHLGLARAYALQGQTTKSRSTYQDFLNLWKDGDPDIPILKQALAEYGSLQ